MVWGANFAVRRSAVERIGEFDESLDRAHGDEEDWLLRLRAAGGRIVYLAEARARPSAQRRRLRAAPAGARRVSPRPRGALQRPPPRRRRRGLAPRAARAGRLRLAHAAARLPAGPDHGRALGGARDGGAAAAMSSHALPTPPPSCPATPATSPTPGGARSAALGELAYSALDTARRHAPARPLAWRAAHRAARRPRDRRVPARLARWPRRCPRCARSATACASRSARPARRTSPRSASTPSPTDLTAGSSRT